MLQPLFVFCADLHLADGAWTSRPGIYGDAYFSLRQIIDYCIAHKLPLVIGGDVLDVKRNSARPIQQLCQAMERMAAEQLPVYYIQGQHELDRNVTWLSVHPWPQNVNKKLFMVNGARLYGIDWLPRGDIQTAFQEAPAEADMLICHQVWKDLMKNIGRPECCLNDVHNVRYVLSGDFHVTKIEHSANAQGAPIQIISPGSTCMQDISESSDKYFFLVSRDPAGEFDFTQVGLRTRAMRAYTVTDAQLLDDLCAGGFAADILSMQDATLPSEIDKPLIRVKFDKRIPDAFLRINTAVGDAAHLFCDAIVDKTRGEQETNRTVTKNDLLAAVSDLLQGHPEAFNLATALLGAETPSAELENQFALFNSLQEQDDAATTAGG